MFRDEYRGVMNKALQRVIVDSVDKFVSDTRDLMI